MAFVPKDSNPDWTALSAHFQERYYEQGKAGSLAIQIAAAISGIFTLFLLGAKTWIGLTVGFAVYVIAGNLMGVFYHKRRDPYLKEIASTLQQGAFQNFIKKKNNPINTANVEIWYGQYVQHVNASIV